MGSTATPKVDDRFEDWIAHAFDISDNQPPSALAELLADDIEMRIGNNPAIHGRQGVIDAFSAPSPVKSTRHIRKAVVIAGDAGTQQSVAIYTLHSGEEVRVPVATYFRRNTAKLIDRAWLFMDFAPVVEAAMRSLGAQPQPLQERLEVS